MMIAKAHTPRRGRSRARRVGRLGPALKLAAALIAALIVLSDSPRAGDAPCAPGDRCHVEGGYYLAAPPPDWDGATALPFIVYFHGWNSSPEATFRNRAMLRAAHARGALFVAPYAQRGYWRQIGDGRAEGGRDEAAFVRAVLADLAARYPLDAERSLASGFSRGASMVWNVACYLEDAFAAYAPIAGGFWGATPGECPAGPIALRHIHGLSDRVVSYDRRGVYNSAPIPEGLALLAQLNACAEPPAAAGAHPRLSCRRWGACAEGAALEICTHSGGHSIPAEWVAEGFDWMLEISAPR